MNQQLKALISARANKFIANQLFITNCNNYALVVKAAWLDNLQVWLLD